MSSATLRERLKAQLVPCPDRGCDCLLWTGNTAGKGYGQLSVGNRKRYVHRVAWELENGPIPAGLQVDHVKDRGCRHITCANVAHLEPVTCRENLLRGDTFTAANAAKTHCPARHPYDPANTYVDAKGCRNCRACHRERQRARQQAARAAA